MQILNIERPQYTLREKQNEDGSFNDYDDSKKDSNNMKTQLNAIQNIINENSRMSEEFKSMNMD